MSLKDDIRFYKAALPKVVKAYSKRAIGDIADNDEQQFRKSQCEACVLFNGSNCDKTLFGREEGDHQEYYALEEVEKATHFIKIKDSYKVLRIVQTADGKKYYRGCGCPQTGKAAKWKNSFTEKELSRLDGTGPCPMGKWSKSNYNNWKNGSTKN